MENFRKLICLFVVISAVVFIATEAAPLEDGQQVSLLHFFSLS